MAQPFDAGKLQTSGDAVPIAEKIGYAAVDMRALFSASRSGVLAYNSAGRSAALPSAQLTWFDRSGKTNGSLGGGVRSSPVYTGFAISHGGSSVALNRFDAQTGLIDIWIYDFARGAESRFALNSRNNFSPTWSPDDSRIAFLSTAGGGLQGVVQRNTNGTGQDELFDGAPFPRVPQDCSPDGRYLVEQTQAPDSKTGFDIWVLPLFGDRKPFPFLHTRANKAFPRLSPSGQWLAYQSDEAGRNEVYVQTFPQPRGQMAGLYQRRPHSGLEPRRQGTLLHQRRR